MATEQSRDGLGGRLLDALLDGMRRNGKPTLRRLARDWQFSLGAVLILGLGIGANTAIFSIINAILFQPQPFADSSRLVNIYQNDANSGLPAGSSYPAFLDIRRQTNVFVDASALLMQEGRYQHAVAGSANGSAKNGIFEYVTANHLDVLGLRPSRGRWFTAEEERSNAPVAVLGYATWVREFQADPSVIGQTIRVGAKQIQLIGVGPAQLNGSQGNATFTALFVPLTALPALEPAWLERRQDLTLLVRARLQEHVEIRQAQAAMDVLAKRLSNEYPDVDLRKGITVIATDDVRISPYVDKQLAPMAAAMLVLVGLVLVIACSNLATLLLVRATSRATEVSLRLALGATRGQLVRHLLMESMVLAFVGAAMGVLVSVGGLRYLATLDLPDLPLVIPSIVDYRVLAFAITLASLCGIGFGLWPALQITRTSLMDSLREQQGSAAGSLSLSKKWFTLKNALIVGQVAGSFLLLMGAGFCMNFLASSQTRSVGFKAKGLAMVQTEPNAAGYDLPHAQAVVEELRRHVAELPGVESVLVGMGLPGDGGFDRNLLIDGYRGGAGADKQEASVEGRWGAPGYFETFGIPLLYGRTFDDRDIAGKQEVAIVNEAMARQYFGSPNAVGRRFRFAGGAFVEVVGVVGNVREVDMIADLPESLFYRTASQEGRAPSAIIARTSGNDAALLALMQQGVRKLHPELPVRGETIELRHARDLAPFRMGMLAMSGLGALGLMLAAIGLYSVIAFAVLQRTSEIGIRMALGAKAGNVAWLVVREVTALVVAGIAVGSAVSLGGLAAIAARVPILGNDPVTVLGVAVVIACCGAMAAYVPARRAVRTDPLVAIRHV